MVTKKSSTKKKDKKGPRGFGFANVPPKPSGLAYTREEMVRMKAEIEAL